MKIKTFVAAAVGFVVALTVQAEVVRFEVLQTAPAFEGRAGADLEVVELEAEGLAEQAQLGALVLGATTGR